MIDIALHIQSFQQINNNDTFHNMIEWYQY